MAIIPQQLKHNLKLYKYSGVDKSLVSKYILGPFWNKFVEYIPLWMAPNLVTLLGFGFVVLNVIITIALSPDLVTPLPSICYLLFGIGLFLYQSFDAVDGKQARRTGQSGPLGELFDHGCDALNTSLTVITLAPTLGYGKSWWMIISLFSTLGNFYLTTWEEYHTGHLYLGWFSGPVEGILTVVFVFLITSILGPEFWTTSFLSTSFTLFDIAMAFGIAIIVFNVVNSVYNVWTATQEQGKSPTEAVLGLLPYVFLCLIVCVWARDGKLVGTALLPLTLYVAFTFAHIVGQVILAHVVKTDYPFWDINFAPALLALAHHATINHNGMHLIPQWLDGAPYVWMCALGSAVVYLRFALLVIRDICDELDIWCLTIKHPKPAIKTE